MKIKTNVEYVNGKNVFVRKFILTQSDIICVAVGELAAIVVIAILLFV